MMSKLVHRGPDSEGLFSDDKCVLGFRRLRIIDLETGEQPQSNEANTAHVIFNGEIYNFVPLRKELESKGHVFRSDSDTEVIVHAYEQYGISCVNRFRGMFAFALWDTEKQRLLIARDRIGKKPLFYFFDGSNFYFASELKALVCVPTLRREIRCDALNQFLTYQYIPAPNTIFKNVYKLPPGNRMVIEADTGESIVGPYSRLEYQPKLSVSFQEAQEQVQETLRDAVRLRMQSDVPFGALLSGGIDSSVVVALMATQSSQKIKTFSIGFEDADFNELPYAREIAQHFGTDHHEYVVRTEIADVLPRIVYFLDEPMGDSSAVPTYYVSQMAREHVTVALNGDGGDESFAGYRSYEAVLRWLHLQDLPITHLKSVVAPLLSRLKRVSDPARVFSHAQTFFDVADFSLAEHFLRQETFCPKETRTRLYSDDVLRALEGTTPAEEFLISQFKEDGVGILDQMLQADVHGYLPGDLLVKMDRMSMAHSLEARSPFLDQEVMQLAARLPEAYKREGKMGKVIIRKAFADLLPRSVWSRKKSGFAIPLASWLRGPLHTMSHDILLSPTALQRGLFRPAAIRQIVEEHRTKVVDHSQAIWGLMVLELWQQQFLDGGL